MGDDAQSIYSFRAATVRNILDFPKHYAGTKIVTLEQNYRSTQPILAATNKVISLAQERFTKNLWSARTDGELPMLVTCQTRTIRRSSSFASCSTTGSRGFRCGGRRCCSSVAP